MKDSHDHFLARAEELFDAERYGEALAQYRNYANHPRAQLMVGWIYHHGLGVQVDVEEARRWYLLAAGQDSIEAQFYLGVLSMKKGEYETGRDLYQRAASQGYMPACYRLAWLYESGNGTPIDKEKAFNLFLQTAKQGHLPSQMIVAKKILRGYRGQLQRPIGLFLVLKTYLQTILVGIRDLHNDRIRF